MIKDDAVLSVLSGKDSILDSLLIGVNAKWEIDGIEEWDRVASDVTLIFRARLDSQYNQFVLNFADIVEMDIFYSPGVFPADICEYKFLKLSDSSFYLSLFPDPATVRATAEEPVAPKDTDQFYIRARNVSCILR